MFKFTKLMAYFTISQVRNILDGIDGMTPFSEAILKSAYIASLPLLPRSREYSLTYSLI